MDTLIFLSKSRPPRIEEFESLLKEGGFLQSEAQDIDSAATGFGRVRDDFTPEGKEEQVNCIRKMNDCIRVAKARIYKLELTTSGN